MQKNKLCNYFLCKTNWNPLLRCCTLVFSGCYVKKKLLNTQLCSQFKWYYTEAIKVNLSGFRPRSMDDNSRSPMGLAPFITLIEKIIIIGLYFHIIENIYHRVFRRQRLIKRIVGEKNKFQFLKVKFFTFLKTFFKAGDWQIMKRNDRVFCMNEDDKEATITVNVQTKQFGHRKPH